MKALVLALCVMFAFAAQDAQADGKVGHAPDRHSKNCDAQSGVLPGYGSPRCRMQAPLAPGERQYVDLFGFRYVVVGTGK